MKIRDLKANIKNPRKITDKNRERLRQAYLKHGDLGGIVFNRRTGNLVGGHQRSSVLPGDAKIKIAEKFDKPTKTGTVALGFIEIEDERYSYREVDWSEEQEAEAMIAANSVAGEWDRELLSVLAADFKELDWSLTDFPELAPLEPIAATEPQEAEEEIESDEEYVANTPETTESIGSTIQQEIEKENAFESVNETTEVKDKRIIIIIDCPSQEVKSEIKDKIQAEVEKMGGKFF